MGTLQNQSIFNFFIFYFTFWQKFSSKIKKARSSLHFQNVSHPWGLTQHKALGKPSYKLKQTQIPRQQEYEGWGLLNIKQQANLLISLNSPRFLDNRFTRNLTPLLTKGKGKHLACVPNILPFLFSCKIFSLFQMGIFTSIRCLSNTLANFLEREYVIFSHSIVKNWHKFFCRACYQMKFVVHRL